MTAVGTKYIVRGMMQVSAGPVVISTVVGAGYALSVVLQGRLGGGLVHLDSRMAKAPAEGLAGRKDTWRLLRDFTARLSSLGSIKGARAEIIGGADVLKILPQSRLQLASDGWVTALSEFLLGYDIAVARVIAQGNGTRKVALNLPAGDVNVTGVGPESGKSPEASRNVTVNMGCMRVDRSPTRLVTLLGSCVGIALYDPTTRIGGLAHVMLPRSDGRAQGQSRFADTAVPVLIEAVCGAGALRGRLEAKIAGGASILFNDEASRFHCIPKDNVALVHEALRQEGIPLVGEDVGGQTGRKMTVDLQDFNVRVTPLCATAGV